MRGLDRIHGGDVKPLAALPRCPKCGGELVMVTGAPKLEYGCRACEALEPAVSFPEWLYRRKEAT